MRRIWVIATIVTLVFCPGLLAAEESVPESPQVFLLKYQDEGLSTTIFIGLEGQEFAFKKEPKYEGKRVVRAALPTAKEKKKHTGFAWDRAAQKLYIDLNGNLDLTDDPTGVYSANYGSKTYASFEDIEIVRGEGASQIKYRFNLTCQRDYVYGNVSSGWQGDVELHGKKHQVSIADDLNGLLGDGYQDRLRIGPVDPALERAARWAQAYTSFPPEGRVFLDGREYTFAFAFKDGDVECSVTESSPPLAELRIEGGSVDYLALDGPVRVLLEQPGPTVQVPAGAYKMQVVCLDSGDTEDLYSATIRRTLQISEGRVTSLVAGAPLRNVMIAKRCLDLLNLDFKTTGIGGESYTNINSYQKPKPQFSVSKGSEEYCTGSFEYG